MMKKIMIAGPAIYTEKGVLENHFITIQQGKIAEINTQLSSHEEVLTFPANYHLVPGFIDMHVHGANNYDVMDATPEALSVLSKTLAVEGVTGYLATTMTASIEKLEHVLQAANDYRHHPVLGANLLGVHLEGPFISPNKVGAQSAKHLLKPDSHIISKWQQQYDHIIKLVTLAPELPNSLALIRYLRDHHIVASIGHSDATYSETAQAIKEGCHYVTHLFNAMRGLHQREPGVVTAALLSEQVTAELIVDGLHLHPAIVELALKLKGMDKLVLVTDAMRAKCLGSGTYELGGQAVHVESGVAKLSNGTLAGSVLRMPDAIRNMMHFTGCRLEEAVNMASANPAKQLKLFDKKGSISVGKEADLVVLDDDFCVVMTMVAGEVVYQIH